MLEANCFYGAGVLEPSTIEEYDRCEGSTRVIDHINYPWGDKGKQVLTEVCIWLKTYGSKSFMVKCSVFELVPTIQAFNLIMTEDQLQWNESERLYWEI